MKRPSSKSLQVTKKYLLLKKETMLILLLVAFQLF